jgi:putative copper export protein
MLPLGTVLGTIKYYALYAHTLGAMVWVGSLVLNAMLFSLRREYRGFALALARRVTPAAWVAAAVLVSTGIVNTIYNPISQQPLGSFADLEVLRTTAYGQFLFQKHIVVTVNLALALFWSWRMYRMAAPVPVPAGAAAAVVAPDGGWGLLRGLAWVQVALAILILYFASHLEFALH